MLRSCSSSYDVYLFAVLSLCEPRCGQCSRGVPTQQLHTGGNAYIGMITIGNLMRIGSKEGNANTSKGIFRQHGRGWLSRVTPDEDENDHQTSIVREVLPVSLTRKIVEDFTHFVQGKKGTTSLPYGSKRHSRPPPNVVLCSQPTANSSQCRLRQCRAYNDVR